MGTYSPSLCELWDLTLDAVFSLATIPWLGVWGGLAISEHWWANAEEVCEVC